MKHAITAIVAPFALALLPACAAIPDAEQPPAATEGTAVTFGQPVRAGPFIATPIRVEEDSRCPMNARCVWAGRLIVTTRIETADGVDITPLTLGVAHESGGGSITLNSGTPERMAGEKGPDQATHFTYESVR